MPNNPDQNPDLFGDEGGQPEESDERRKDWQDRSRRRAAEHQKQQLIERENRISDDKLNFWSDEKRAGIPPELARGAIFRLPRRGRRRHFNADVLIERPSLKIGFTGTELDQFDGDVYLAIVRALRGQNYGQRVEINLKGLAHEIRRVQSGGTVETLRNSLKRLSSCTIHLEFCRHEERYHANIHLVGWVYEEKTRQTFVRLYADAAKLFEQLAWLDFEKHLALPTDLSRMLHMYVTSHRRGRRRSAKLDEFMELTGSRSRRNDFRARLHDALCALATAGIIDEIAITSVDVVRWRLLGYDQKSDDTLNLEDHRPRN